MPKAKRATIALNRRFYERVQRVVENGNLGYDSPTDFIKEAIREKLKEVDPKGSKISEEEDE